MKSAILMLLLSVLLASCTASAQTSIKTETESIQKPGSCLTAAPVCESLKLPSNIKINAASVVATFDGYDIYLGKTWNCLAIYEGDDILYFGDQDHFWLNDSIFVVQGGDFKISVDMQKGTARMEEPGNLNRILNFPKYNGKCNRSDWSIVQKAN